MILALLVGLGVLVGAGPVRAQSDDPPTVIVLVVDGLMPDEVGPTTPALQALKDQSTWYEESRSVMIAETIPNHVAMMTGVYPERSNIAANRYWDRDESAVEERDLSDPAELTADTLFTTVDRACPDISTASILSKEYLHEVFRAGGQNVAADFHWEPGPLIPESDHTPDLNTMGQALAALSDHDLLFISLGDVDRAGHVDIVGGFYEVPADLGIPALPTPNNAALRQAVLRDTDALIGQLVRDLTSAGRWDETVLFVVSDHGMDWAQPFGFVNAQPVLDRVEPDRFFLVNNGAAATVYLRHPGRADDDADLAAARAAIVAEFPDEVTHAWYRRPNPADPTDGRVVPARYRLDSPNAGDLVLAVADGWRFMGDNPRSNPLPGNHGHPHTLHNTFLVGGGHPALAGPQSIAAPAADPLHTENFEGQSENVDVAPTVAWLFGLPTDDHQGRVLTEAFDVAESPFDCSETATGAEPRATDPGTSDEAVAPSAAGAADQRLPATGPLGGRRLLLAAVLVAAGALAGRGVLSRGARARWR